MFDLTGEYRLDDNRRVAKRLATLAQMEESLAYEESRGDLTRVVLDRRREELESLRPYFSSSPGR
jgi:hypothetical protein